MREIGSNLERIRQAIREAEMRYRRAPGSVQLLAVSKTKPVSAIRDAYAAGARAFGENYLQEALAKQAELSDLPLEWHFIGAIQSRKAREIAQHFDWVHTVDRPKVAEALSRARSCDQPSLNVLIQLNLQEEEQKAGVAASAVAELAAVVSSLPGLRLRGLMLIPRPETEFSRQRAIFAEASGLLEALNREGYQLDELSMGMTDDLVAAIAEGATWVRIGTAIFGARAPRD